MRAAVLGLDVVSLAARWWVCGETCGLGEGETGAGENTWVGELFACEIAVGGDDTIVCGVL